MCGRFGLSNDMNVSVSNPAREGRMLPRGASPSPSEQAPRGSLARRIGAAFALVVAAWLLPFASAAAQAGEIELPPDPRDRPPALSVEPRIELGVPMVSRRLCPSGSGCVYGSGFGIGVLVERRYRSGVGLGIAYDVRFLDAEDVYELATLQTISVSFRYFFSPLTAAHPFLGVQAGGAIFGDTFRVATMGFHVDGVAGVEVEAMPSLSFTLFTGVRALYTRPFTSRPDDVQRSRSGGLDLSWIIGGGAALRFERP